MVHFSGNNRPQKWDTLLISPPVPSSEPPPPYSPPRNQSSINNHNTTNAHFPFFPSDLSVTKKARASLNHGPSSAFHPPSKVKALGEPPPYSISDLKDSHLNKSYDVDAYNYNYKIPVEKYLPHHSASHGNSINKYGSHTLRSPKKLYEHSSSKTRTAVAHNDVINEHHHPHGPLLRTRKSLQIPGSSGLSHHSHPPSTIHLHPSVDQRRHNAIHSTNPNRSDHVNVRSPMRSHYEEQCSRIAVVGDGINKHGSEFPRSPPAHAPHIARPISLQGRHASKSINYMQVSSPHSLPYTKIPDHTNTTPLKSQTYNSNMSSERTHYHRTNREIEPHRGDLLRNKLGAYTEKESKNIFMRRDRLPNSTHDYPFSDSEELNHVNRRSRLGRHINELSRETENGDRRRSTGVCGGRTRRTVRLEQEAAHSMTPVRAFPVHITTPRMRSCRSLDELSDLLHEDLDLMDSSTSPVPSMARSLDDLTEPLYINVPTRQSHSSTHYLNTSVPDILDPPPLPAKPKRGRTISLSPIKIRDEMTSLQEQLEKIKRVAMVLGNKVERGEFVSNSTSLHSHSSNHISSRHENVNVAPNSAFKRIYPPHINRMTPPAPGVPSRAPVINDVSFLLNQESTDKFNITDPSIVHASFEDDGQTAATLLDFHSSQVRHSEDSPEDLSLPYSHTPDPESSSHESGYSSTDSRSGTTQKSIALVSNQNHCTSEQDDNSFEQRFKHSTCIDAFQLTNQSSRHLSTRHQYSPPDRSYKQIQSPNCRQSHQSLSPPRVQTLPQFPNQRRFQIDEEYKTGRSTSCTRVNYSSRKAQPTTEITGPISMHNKLYGSMDQLKMDIELNDHINRKKNCVRNLNRNTLSHRHNENRENNTLNLSSSCNRSEVSVRFFSH